MEPNVVTWPRIVGPYAAAMGMTMALVACSAPQVVQRRLTPLEHALELRDRGQLPEAEAELRVLVGRGEEGALSALGETLMLRGHHAEAVELLKPALQTQPDDPGLALALARAADGCGRVDDAVAAYARRLTLRPDDADAAARMTELLLLRGDAAHASQVAHAGLKSHPEHAGLLVQSARALLARGRPAQALDDARKATAIAAQMPDAWMVLGEVQLTLGVLDEADKAFRQTLTLAGDDATVLRHLGMVQLERGELQAAQDSLLRARKLSPDDPQVWLTIAAVRQRARDAAGAVTALQETLRLQPKWVSAHRFYAEVLLDDGWPAQARTEATAALELARGQKQGGDPAACEEVLARTIVAQVLTEAMCARQPHAADLDGAVLTTLQAAGIRWSQGQVVQAGAAVAAQVKAAAARCAKPAGGTP
jgi:Flp pilus assembly protein TadD